MIPHDALSSLKTEFKKKYLELSNSEDGLGIEKKKDQSLVTKLDHFVHLWAKENLPQGEENFFSEEEVSELKFPSYVVDPIDGTRGLVIGNFECCISVGFLNSPMINDPLNWGWIYNPFTGFEIHSEYDFKMKKVLTPPPYHGMVSRSDWESGKVNLKKSDKTIISPKGSIALKIGLLSASMCDFVYSETPKNIWDIAAGTIIAQKNGIGLFDSKFAKIENLERELIVGPMYWCNEEILKYL